MSQGFGVNVTVPCVVGLGTGDETGVPLGTHNMPPLHRAG